MSGETNLTVLLRGMSPRLNQGRYVFTIVPAGIPVGVEPVVTVRGAEGLTVVLGQEQADNLGLSYDFVAAWITLEVHWALDAVGLTAAFSRALTEARISANVVAGYTHDHVFVPHGRADDAMSVLTSLAGSASA